MSIFLRDKEGTKNFEGMSWPGVSCWVDFLNIHARHYWSSLYSYDNFKGTNHLYSYWIDMNEPSVSDSDESTMPKEVLHIAGDGSRIKHRDAHNIYGVMMAKATYEGVMMRDQNTTRPFILTRSAFMGS